MAPFYSVVFLRRSHAVVKANLLTFVCSFLVFAPQRDETMPCRAENKVNPKDVIARYRGVLIVGR